MGERRVDVDDLIQCLECGHWFRSLGGHTLAAHGMTAREYKLEHGYPLGAGLDGRDTAARRHLAGVRNIQRHPEIIQSLWNLPAAEELGEGDPVDLFRARIAENTAAYWADKLASCGWAMWEDAAAWAIENNVGWAAVAERMGVTENPVMVRAKIAGVTLEQVLSAHQLEMLDKLHHHAATHGSLRAGLASRSDPADRELHDFLRRARLRWRQGEGSRIYAALDAIDRHWRRPPPRPAPQTCVEIGCQDQQVAKERCRRHYDHYRDRREREEAGDAIEEIACLECGKGFARLGTHLTRVHGITASEYRERHDLDPDRPLRVPRASRSGSRRRRDDGAESEVRAAFAEAGWTSWDDAVEWAMRENQGWVGIGRRLGFGRQKASRLAAADGVRLLPALSETQAMMVHYARQHVAATGSIDHAPDAGFSSWLAGVRNDRRRRDATSRVHVMLDQVAPGWYDDWLGAKRERS